MTAIESLRAGVAIWCARLEFGVYSVWSPNADRSCRSPPGPRVDNRGNTTDPFRKEMPLGEGAGALPGRQEGQEIGVGRTFVWGRMAKDEVDTAKPGRATRIPATEIRRFVAGLMATAR